MPEGDTIWRAARALDATLAGRTVRSFHSVLPVVAVAAERMQIVGCVLLRVEARGKHLLFLFGGRVGARDERSLGDGRAPTAGAVLHTHQGMHGRWQVEPITALPRPARGRSAQVTIDFGDLVARCLRASVVELLEARAAARHPALVRLGPDILGAGFDPAQARARLRVRGNLEIAVALLDQTALAGIGNVYKSEALFLCGVAPRARVAELDDSTLDRIVETARRLMRRNLRPGPRRTTSAFDAERLYVYRRSGRPCRRCGGTIGRLVQGEQARSTYFCPRCQGMPDAGAPR